MKIGEQYKCKRLALGMTQADFADLCGVSSATISKFERGEFLSQEVYNTIKETVERYIRSLDADTYYEIRIVEAALSLQYKNRDQKLRTLSHLMVHVGKLNMDLLRDAKEEEWP
jgi:transcriptional regulator with XRE-family HTH domain